MTWTSKDDQSEVNKNNRSQKQPQQIFPEAKVDKDEE